MTSIAATSMRFTARTFAVNDNRDLQDLSLSLRLEGDLVLGTVEGLFPEPVEVHGRRRLDEHCEHLSFEHGREVDANQAKFSLVSTMIRRPDNRSLVGSFEYTTNGHVEQPSWPVHNCTLVPAPARAPSGEAPASVDIPAASSELVIEPGKEYYMVELSEGMHYLSVEHRGNDASNWAYRGNSHEHDYCKVKFSCDPLKDFATLTMTNGNRESRTLRANSTSKVWAYLMWDEGERRPSEPILRIKAERAGPDTFTFYHQRLAQKMWLGFGGTGGNWGVIEGERETPVVFQLVEVPPGK